MDTKQQTAVMERRFWKRLCALNRFSFFVLAGGVARAADKAGNWIEAHSAQEIVDDAECEVSALKQRIADLEARLEVADELECTAQAVPVDAESWLDLLAEARAALWQPANAALCERLDAFNDAARAAQKGKP